MYQLAEVLVTGSKEGKASDLTIYIDDSAEQAANKLGASISKMDMLESLLGAVQLVIEQEKDK